MLASESPLLLSEVLILRSIDREFDSTKWHVGEEVVVYESTGQYILRQDDRTALMELTPKSGAADAYAQDPGTIWVLARAKGKELGFRCGRPADSYQLQQGFDIGVDQRVADDLLTQRKTAAATPEAAIAWLADEFLCPGGAGSTRRAFAAKMSRAKADQLQLVGRSSSLDAHRTAGGNYVVDRVRPRSRNALHAYTVLEGDIRFADIEGGLRVQSGDERATLDAAVTSYGTYLELWQLYSELEWRREVGKAAEIGAIRYTRIEPASQEGGAWRFYAATDDVSQFCARWRDGGVDADAEVEAEDVAPDWRSERYTDLSSTDSARRFRGAPEFHQNSVVVFSRASIEPPDSGYLYLSLAGDRKQHERRLRARTAIEAGIGVPRLRSLLQDLPISGQRPSRHPALTPYARASFKFGRPTARQEDAIRVALNTPDIALIIGPPGTGKTQVIAALERRFAELNEGRVIAHEVLVSSFQHDAVENALERTSVYGLPAIKVGSRNAPTDSVDRWCEERLHKVNEHLAKAASAEPHIPLIRELDHLSRALRLGSVPSSEHPQALERVSALVEDLGLQGRLRISAQWQQDWNEFQESRVLKQRQAAVQITPVVRRRLLRQTRALRTQVESYLDDGAIRAASLLYEASDVAGLLTEGELELLQEARTAVVADANLLALVTALQEALIDRLRPDMRPAIISDQLDPVGAELLERMHGEIEAKMADRRIGRYEVLRRYRDALECNPARTRRTVEQYSSIVGATCQQAASMAMSKLKSVTADLAGAIQFNSVVVDEAARANPLDLFIPMAMARRRIVLVGDHRQLPHLLDPEVEDDVVRVHGDADRKVYQQSLFERLWLQLKNRESVDGFPRVVMLDTQFRMHPTLGDFVSRHFYEAHGLGRIESGRKADEFCESVPGFGSVACAWIDVPARQGLEEKWGSSRRRPREASRVAAEVKRLIQDLPSHMSLGVITFYAAQRDQIFEELLSHGISCREESGWRIADEHVSTKECAERLRIGTVDAFQGKEFDVVLLSTVRCNDSGLDADADDEDPAFQKAASRKYGHLRVDNRLNVAMSRQRRLLVGMGDRAMFTGAAARRAVPEMSAFLELCDNEARRGR